MRLGQQGGNRRRQTYADCEQCVNRFGPLDRLSHYAHCDVIIKRWEKYTGKKAVKVSG